MNEYANTNGHPQVMKAAVAVMGLRELTNAVHKLNARLDDLQAQLDGMRENLVAHERALGTIGAYEVESERTEAVYS